MPVSVANEVSRPTLWEGSVRGGDCWSHVLKRGTSLRLTDLEGGANVAALIFNFDILSERYNMPDTLKAQHTAHLKQNHVLYSDMGRVLLSIVSDSCGWHDPLCSHLDQATTEQKYGKATYQERRNDFHRNARDNFLIEMEKYGLTLRDLGANVNFFSKVVVQPDGSMHYVTGHSKAGDHVELRAEMNTLVILDTCQHVLDPSRVYHPKPVKLNIFKSAPAAADDSCRTLLPENARGFENTETYFL